MPTRTRKTKPLAETTATAPVKRNTGILDTSKLTATRVDDSAVPRRHQSDPNITALVDKAYDTISDNTWWHIALPTKAERDSLVRKLTTAVRNRTGGTHRLKTRVTDTGVHYRIIAR